MQDASGCTPVAEAQAGNNNAPDVVLPAGLRIPVSGMLLIADADGSGVTQVPNVSAADVVAADADLENMGGDAIQLISPAGTLWDVLGTSTTGASLAVATRATEAPSPM